ncbi:MAG TPA: DUF1707 domain-containing protein [Pseudonocardiaceae bacterium]|nr:DUF1707 domain-containing protein [Pseudonocardiaceae bacterium]
MTAGPAAQDGDPADEAGPADGDLTEDADSTADAGTATDARPVEDTTRSARPTGVRASDAEREAFAQTVLAAGRDGRLGVEEIDERLAEVYASTFRDELPELVKDLPREDWPAGFGVTPSTEPGPDRLRGSVPATRTWNSALTTHTAIVSVMAVFAVVGWIRSGVPFFWPAWPIAWLGISVLVHYRIRLRRQRWLAAGGGWPPWGPAGRRWDQGGPSGPGGRPWGPPVSPWGPQGRSRFDRVDPLADPGDDPWRRYRGDRGEPPVA